MTPSEYNNLIPQPGNTIADGQKKFFSNFFQLNAAFSSDHIPLTQATDQGNHTVVRFAEQKNSLSTNVSEIAAYSKQKVNQTTQLYFREQGNQLEYLYSNYQIYPLDPIVIGGVTVQIPYFSFLPGNKIVYFGEIHPNTNPFKIIIEPAICTNIDGINFCNIFPQTITPPLVSLTLNTNAQCTSVDLYSAISTFLVTPQYYIIFGNPL